MEPRLPELLEAVRLRYVAAELNPDQTLLILSSTENYPLLIDAYCTAAVTLGARPILITYQSAPSLSGLPDAIIEMVAQADQLVDLCYKTSIYTDSFLEINKRLNERGGRRLDGHLFGWEEDVDYIIQCPPSDDVAERAKRAQKMIDSAKIIRVTSDLGTDLTLARGDANVRLSYLHYPPSQVAISPPEDKVDGVIHFVGGFRIQYPTVHTRMVYEPVKMEIKKGMLVKIHRDNEVGILLDEWFKAQKDANAYQFAHINIGFDPRIALHNLDNMALHFNEGGVLMGFGTNYWPGVWGTVLAKCHIDMALVGADYLLDGKHILKGGEFTLDSGLSASKQAEQAGR